MEETQTPIVKIRLGQIRKSLPQTMVFEKPNRNMILTNLYYGSKYSFPVDNLTTIIPGYKEKISLVKTYVDTVDIINRHSYTGHVIQIKDGNNIEAILKHYQNGRYECGMFWNATLAHYLVRLALAANAQNIADTFEHDLELKPIRYSVTRDRDMKPVYTTDGKRTSVLRYEDRLELTYWNIDLDQFRNCGYSKLKGQTIDNAPIGGLRVVLVRETMPLYERQKITQLRDTLLPLQSELRGMETELQLRKEALLAKHKEFSRALIGSHLYTQIYNEKKQNEASLPENDKQRIGIESSREAESTFQARYTALLKLYDDYFSSPERLLPTVIQEKHRTADQLDRCILDFIDRNVVEYLQAKSNRDRVKEDLDANNARINTIINRYKWTVLTYYMVERHPSQVTTQRTCLSTSSGTATDLDETPEKMEVDPIEEGESFI